jgi:hypothetical protein
MVTLVTQRSGKAILIKAVSSSCDEGSLANAVSGGLPGGVTSPGARSAMRVHGDHDDPTVGVLTQHTQ